MIAFYDYYTIHFSHSLLVKTLLDLILLSLSEAGAGVLEWDWKLLPLLNFILLVDRNNFFILILELNE